MARGRVIVFAVHGTPAAQGSKRAVVRGGKAVMFETLKATRPWRDSVASAAVDAMTRFAGDVRARRFPDDTESYHLADDVAEVLGLYSSHPA